VHHCAALGHQRLLHDLVLAIQVEDPVLDEVLQKRRDILRVHLARVIRNRRRQIQRTENLHAVVHHGLAWPRQLAIPAALRRDVDDYRPRRHPRRHLRRDQNRSAPPRHRRRRDHDVLLRQYIAQRLPLLAIELLAHRLRVPALVLRARRFHVQHDEPRAETLDLLLHRRANVVPADDRAQPTRRRDRLQSRDARADHQHTRWRNRSRCRHQHRKHAGQGIGRDQHRLIARDRGHRGERVHALRARNARHQLHREERDPAFRQESRRLDRGQRLAESDDGLPAPHERQVRR
jgi:hypothetical protein